MRHINAFILTALLLAPLAITRASKKPLSDFRSLVREETWTEKWPDASGESESRTVTAEV